MLDSLMISIPEYFASLKFSALMRALPGGIAQGLIWGILALGVFMTFRMLGISDLTVDGSMATGGAVCIMLVLKGVNPQLALLASFFAGMAAGVITGFLHTRLGIPDILAGILTQISLYSINLNIMGKANQAVNVNKVSFLFSSNAKLLTRTIYIVFFVCAALVGILYLYLGTEHGSALRATGINGNMARAQGINTSRMKVIGLAISNGLVALSGGIMSQYQGFADVKGHRCHRHRSGSGDYRRGAGRGHYGQAHEFYDSPCLYCSGKCDLLCGVCVCPLAEVPCRRHEAAHCRGGGNFPGCAQPAFCQAQFLWAAGKAECQKSQAESGGLNHVGNQKCV